MRQTIRLFAILSAVFLFTALIGCMGRGPRVPIRFYSFPEGFHTTATTEKATSIRLGIGSFESSGAIGKFILFRVSPVEVKYNRYERWVEQPNEIITRAFLQALDSSGFFSEVTLAEDIAFHQSTHLLRGYVDRFENDRSVSPPCAVLSVRLELRDIASGRRVWESTVSYRHPIQGRETADFVRAMEEAIRRVLEKSLSDMKNGLIKSK